MQLSDSVLPLFTEEDLFSAGSADVAVIGAGHAGIEAALACARLGQKTLLFTINLDAVANMPCNPSIGGTGKGQLVYEIDALGGEMGRAADRVTLQSRTLNLGKGPAVHSKRIQADRTRYRALMKHTLEQQENLSLIQAEIVDVLWEEGKVCGVVTRLGAIWKVRAVIVCTGTYLNGKIIIGNHAYTAGPDGMLAATHLTASLAQRGIRFLRFKTGTPARILRSSVDFSRLEVQPGEEHITPYSADSEEAELNARSQLPCHILYTNAQTHAVILKNLHRSPLYSGKVEGTGPRYCPSIEDKVVRFSDKERHQLFLEPMGADTEELYLQGFSSSLPEDVQMEMLHTLPGMEHAQVMRTAYAIEYDCIDPTQLDATLAFRDHAGLFGAGQFNGTSGYEEAAAQGLIAGINAARWLSGQEPLRLTRDSSYIGTLIDDLVTKGTKEPYRMMTSRSEYRLLLRQDNADARLCKIGYEIGLVSEARYARFLEKQAQIEAEITRLGALSIPPSDSLNARLCEENSAPLQTAVRATELLKRPGITYQDLAPYDPQRPDLPLAVLTEVQIQIKYEGYIRRQKAEAEKVARLEHKKLPQDVDYSTVRGLRLEAQQKLNALRPHSIGQASRISGVSPADLSVLLIWLGQ